MIGNLARYHRPATDAHCNAPLMITTLACRTGPPATSGVRPDRVCEEGNMPFSGFDIVIPVLVVLVLLVLFRRHQDRAAGLQLHGRALRPLHQHADARPQPHHSLHRPHRRQDEHDGAGARRSDPGGHHPRQRHRRRRRRRLLPDAQRAAGGLSGRRPAERHPQPDHDQHPLGHGLDGPRRASVQPRRDQRAAAARRRRGRASLGHQDHPRRDQGHQPAGQPGRLDGAAR